MEKKIASYQTMFVVDATLAEDVIAAVVAKFVTLINDNATDVVVNEWGKRRLAYPINYKNEGYSVLVNFKSEPTFPRELQRVLGITDGIIRAMTTSFNGTVGTPATAEVAPAEKAEEAAAVSVAAEESAE